MPAAQKFDVVIAGGGLIGGAIAFELARAGLRVALFDRQQLGLESSWAGAGILSPAPENPAMLPAVPLCKASLAAYRDFVSAIEELSGRRCGFRPKGTIEALFSRDVRAELSTIIAVHHGVGLRAEPLCPEDARELEPALSEQLEAAILRPDEASVDNRALTAAVLEAATRAGAHLFPGSEATAIWREGGRCRGLLLGGEKVAAEWTVIAAGCFSAGIVGVALFAPVHPAKGQMLALRAPSIAIERVLWSDKVYLVPRDDGRILAGATVEYVGFDKRPTAAAIEKLLAAAIELAPALADASIEEFWAGLRPDSPDHLPILGPTDVEGLLIATGHFRSGILLAPVTARLIREWVTLRSVSIDCDRFSPLRFQAAAEAAHRAPA
jgi:glycine oxidase